MDENSLTLTTNWRVTYSLNNNMHPLQVPHLENHIKSIFLKADKLPL